MHKLTIKKDCTYFHKGYERKDYEAGQEVETDDDEFAAVAKGEGWAVAAGEKAAKPAENKARKAAPENK